MRSALFGLTFIMGAAIAVSSAGCGTADDRPLEKNPEYVATTTQPIVARVDCNDQRHVTTKVVALSLGTDGSGNPVYQRSVSALLADLSSTACASNYGAAACKDWHDYTAAIYSQVYGAAGYYYRVGDILATNGGQVPKYWIAIPILDSTTSTPGYYGSYPGGSHIHTPAFAPPVFAPPASSPNTQSPFWLHDADHSNLWAVQSGPLNTSNVQGRVEAQQCIAIVDPAGNFLDYSAELEEHDPNSCASCKY